MSCASLVRVLDELRIDGASSLATSVSSTAWHTHPSTALRGGYTARAIHPKVLAQGKLHFAEQCRVLI